MQQPGPTSAERRAEPRLPKAFAFYFRHTDDQHRSSAWMLDSSGSGAAFLTAVEQAPPIGQWIELFEMPAHDRLVREDAGPLPRYARVLRHDEGLGMTRRVAVRFETPQHAVVARPRTRLASATQLAPRRTPIAPPLATSPPDPFTRAVAPPAESSAGE